MGEWGFFSPSQQQSSISPGNVSISDCEFRISAVDLLNPQSEIGNPQLKNPQSEIGNPQLKNPQSEIGNPQLKADVGFLLMPLK